MHENQDLQNCRVHELGREELGHEGGCAKSKGVAVADGENCGGAKPGAAWKRAESAGAKEPNMMGAPWTWTGAPVGNGGVAIE